MSCPITPALAGGILLLARSVATQWSVWPDTPDLLGVVNASRSQAYEMFGRLQSLLPTLTGRPGRPPTPPVETALESKLQSVVYDYVWDHPGAFHGVGERRHYSDGFRRFVVGLLDEGQPGAGLSLASLASCLRIPLGTLKDWLRPPAPASPSANPAHLPEDLLQPTPATAPPTPASPPEEQLSPFPADLLRNVHLQQIVALYEVWEGSFKDFCRMVATEYRLPQRATFIGNFLQGMGLRKRRRRRPVEAPWSGNTWRNFFPGAQWLADGTSLAVYWGKQIFVFNLEAFLDSASNSTVGFSVLDSENAEAIRQAYLCGKQTTGSKPLGCTVDNKLCNLCDETLETFSDTILLRATPGRGQAKAPLEGSFGVFQQTMPALIIEAGSPREMARCVLELVLTAWYRGRNGRPRQRLGGMSPREAYDSAKPTQEEIDEVLRYFREQHQRQERARQTREARRDPVRMELLQQGLESLEIPDPKRLLSIALAGFARDAIVRGLATFSAKKQAGTLPQDADPGRYLGGIIRNIHERIELTHFSIEILEQRIRLRDISLAKLEFAAQELCANTPSEEVPKAFVDRALQAYYTVDFLFWARNAAKILTEQPRAHRRATYNALVRRITASYKANRDRRADLIDMLAEAATAESAAAAA